MIEAFKTPLSVAQEIAARAKQRRTSMRFTQLELAQKAGLSLSAYRRFEQKGQIALSGLLQIAFALDCMSDFNALFASQSWATMDDMLTHAKPAKRVRHD
ncbi:MAG: helix-turn-helix transcriptional regulator [Bacteroidales bacterium]|nr:helix-turn-helix transcriptional regulator [Bacteroidales bacterium]